jgi:hypothetical protein
MFGNGLFMSYSTRSRFINLLGALALLWSCAEALRASAAETAGSTIYFTNGSHAVGKLLDSPSGDNLLWQSPSFTRPFTFPLNAVTVVHFPVPAKLPQPEGDYAFELTGGDVLFGALVSLNGDTAVVDAKGLGRLLLERGIVRRMFRWDGADLLYFGPSGLRGW